MGNYKVGKALEGWGGENAQTLTFIVTEDCNLRCKYCYITHKSSNKVMKFDVAKKFIDYLLDNNIIKKEAAVVLDFIGGEPLLEIELIDKICDYYKLETYRRNLDISWKYRINISTNGMNYGKESVQKFLEKNKFKVSIGITIDGTKEKHDSQRVCIDNTGSYDKIIDNVKLWVKDTHEGTKVTFASEDLKYLKESIIHLWDLGIKSVSANVVFENVWKDGDDIIFEQQLRELADYIIDNKLYDEYYCTLFSDSIGYPYTARELKCTSCGAGKMLALGPDGNIYPCLRYKNYSLNNKEELTFGNVYEGIDFDKVRPFHTLMFEIQSDDECINCDVASGCGFCQGFNYDEADTPTNFQRAKYICKMHKARVRANNYYFARLFNEYGINKELHTTKGKVLKFLLSDDYVNHCTYNNKSTKSTVMTEEKILDGLKYAYDNFFSIVFVHSRNKFNFKMRKEYNEYLILHIIPAKFIEMSKILKKYILVFEEENDFENIGDISFQQNVILNVKASEISTLYEKAYTLFNLTNRINVNILDLDKNFDLELYKNQLLKIKDFLVNEYNKNKNIKEFNVITDLSFTDEHDGCNAGKYNFTYAPDGNIYLCQAFYSDMDNKVLDKLSNEKLKNPNKQLYSLDKQPLCKICDVYHCDRCIYMNNKRTNEVNIPPEFKCKKSHIERQVAVSYYNSIGNEFNKVKLKEIDYLDPMLVLKERINNNTGFNICNR